MPLLYALVARAEDCAVLAVRAAVNGNFESVISECLERACGSPHEERCTISCDGHTYVFLFQGEYAFVVAGDEATGREAPLACAKRISAAWMEQCADRGRYAEPYAMQHAFSPVMQREMEYCDSNPDGARREAAVKRKVDEVKGIMAANVESALDRGDDINTLDQQAGGLEDQAARFQEQGRRTSKRMGSQRLCAKCCCVTAVVVFVAAVFLIACFAGTHSCVDLARSKLHPESSVSSEEPSDIPAGASPAGLGAPTGPVPVGDEGKLSTKQASGAAGAAGDRQAVSKGASPEGAADAPAISPAAGAEAIGSPLAAALTPTSAPAGGATALPARAAAPAAGLAVTVPAAAAVPVVARAERAAAEPAAAASAQLVAPAVRGTTASATPTVARIKSEAGTVSAASAGTPAAAITPAAAVPSAAVVTPAVVTPAVVTPAVATTASTMFKAATPPTAAVSAAAVTTAAATAPAAAQLAPAAIQGGGTIAAQGTAGAAPAASVLAGGRDMTSQP